MLSKNKLTPTEQAKVAELVDFAARLVQAVSGQALTDVNKLLLEQALCGMKLKDINVTGYASTTVERVFAPRLWALLSEVTHQKVSIKNVRLILEELWKQELSQSSQLPQADLWQDTRINPVLAGKGALPIIENLPAPTNSTFVGREAEIIRLLELLSPDHSAHLISIAGIGGVGKTSLAVECARRCLAASCHSLDSSGLSMGVPTFDVFIFVSAKLVYLEPFGLLERFGPARSLQDILQQIADVLGDVDLAGASFTEQITLLKKRLGGVQSNPTQRRTLLIIDNLETVENQQAVLSFLYDLPRWVKVVITTREQLMFVPVRLTAMPEPEGLKLIEYEAQEKGVSLGLDDRQSLYQATGGVPVAIHYAIGQIANGYPLAGMLQGIKQSTGEVARFCFETTVQALRGMAAHDLLMAIALFPAPVLCEVLFQVAAAEPDPEQLQEGLAQLCRLSLVNQTEDRYSMLPLTQEYAYAELKAHPTFAEAARRRWVNWALRHSEVYAAVEAKTWHLSYDGLHEEWQNLRAIADCCMVERWYPELLKLWRNIEPYTYNMGRRKGRKDYWGDRLRWTEWLIQQATQHGDWQTASHVMLDRAWTLTAIRKPQPLAEAESLFQQLQALQDYQEVCFQMEWAKKLAVLYFQQKRFEEAQDWLDCAEALLDQTELSEYQHDQQLVQIHYYRGMIFFKANQIERSQLCFAASCTLAKAIGWERAVRMAENWLADIAVYRGDLDIAEQMLVEGLRVGQMQDDPTRMAYIKRSFAELVQARGNDTEAKRWAIEALEIFDRLGMSAEVEEVQELINHLHIRELQNSIGVADFKE
jgi:LuxR family glucitol operon transcriptional activator